ncbi:peptide chain release factor N(5)-glutamine methyltransferase [soil metagenome]
MPDLTVGRLVADSTARLRDSGSESARLDAELLLGHVLGIGRASVLAHPEAPVSTTQAAQFQALVARRGTGEPVAYIRGLKEFYGLAFGVDRRALIPRPETELLVDLALERLGRALASAPRPVGAQPLLAWDVGTGSGAVAISLATEARRRRFDADVRFLATDVSADALALATENAVAHGVADLVRFAPADLLGLPDAPVADIVIANLPYVPAAVVPTLPVAASFEPVLALDGGADGLDLVRRLLDRLPTVLGEGGVALLEIGSDQADTLRDEAARRLPGWTVAVHPDLADQARAAELSRP